MKIVGGNFGVNGSAFISKDRYLVIEGAKRGAYPPEQIHSVTASVTKERKFGALGFIVGAIVLGIVLGLLLSVLGVIIAIVVALAGSFYSESKNTVEIKFTDEKAVLLECTPRGVKKLVAFGP